MPRSRALARTAPRRVSCLRHDRPSDGRRDGDHRQARRAPDQAGADDRRHGHGSRRDRHSRRTLPAALHRRGPAHPGRHAGSGHQLRAHLLCEPSALGQARTTRRQSRASSAPTRRARASPCKGGGPNDYCYIYTSRATSGSTGIVCSNSSGARSWWAIRASRPPEMRFKHRDEVDVMVSNWTRKIRQAHCHEDARRGGRPRRRRLRYTGAFLRPAPAPARRRVRDGHASGARRFHDARLAGPYVRVQGADRGGPSPRRAQPARSTAGLLGLSENELAALREEKVI